MVLIEKRTCTLKRKNITHRLPDSGITIRAEIILKVSCNNLDIGIGTISNDCEFFNCAENMFLNLVSISPLEVRGRNFFFCLLFFTLLSFQFSEDMGK